MVRVNAAVVSGLRWIRVRARARVRRGLRRGWRGAPGELEEGEFGGVAPDEAVRWGLGGG